MEIRHLRYFLAVAEEKNFTRAAQRLFIAQPPLSRQIQQLEEELGVPLFEKGSRPLRLTEAGKFFQVHAQNMLEKLADMKTMTQRVGKIGQTLSIGYVASTLYGLLPEIVRLFREANQGVHITFHEMTTMEQMRGLKDGSIDVGFGRVVLEDPSIRRILLREERLIVALPLGHRLAEQERPIRLIELLPENLIVYPKAPRPSFADQVLAAFSAHSLRPENVMEVRELHIAIGMVAAGQGISIVPDSLQGMKRSDVLYREIEDMHAVSPILFNVRLMDQSDELRNILKTIYSIYDARGIAHVKEEL
ncbi:LysR family transcriptional regulator [Pseudoduganella sp. UC29_106]|uniref:LysR family transcriptional regulator n=1 Tax=Pseudoduganella sp. UC29_106 TaxID=3374553 RepID=UPI0037583FE7